MPNDIDLSNEALLKHREIAEKATQENGENIFIDCISHKEANTPDVVIAHIDEILRLRNEVERLNKEADWLADHCSEFCESYGYCGECPMFHGWLKCVYEVCGKAVGCRGDNPTCNWREAASKAVEEKA